MTTCIDHGWYQEGRCPECPSVSPDPEAVAIGAEALMPGYGWSSEDDKRRANLDSWRVLQALLDHGYRITKQPDHIHKWVGNTGGWECSVCGERQGVNYNR